MKRAFDEKNENISDPRLLLAREMRDPLRVVCAHLGTVSLAHLQGVCRNMRTAVNRVHRYCEWVAHAREVYALAKQHKGVTKWVLRRVHTAVHAREHEWVRWAVKMHSDLVRHVVLVAYGECGDLERARRFVTREHHFVMIRDALLANGYLREFWTLWARGCNTASVTLVGNAAQSGDLEMVKWAQRQTKRKSWMLALRGAAVGNHVHVAQWVLQQLPSVFTGDALAYCARGDALDVARLLLPLQHPLVNTNAMRPRKDGALRVLTLYVERDVVDTYALMRLLYACIECDQPQNVAWIAQRLSIAHRTSARRYFQNVAPEFISLRMKHALETTLAKY